MSDKLFKNDKNYILKKVQLNTKKTLINYLILKSIERYELLTNPLGLNDNTSNFIKNFKINNYKKLNFFFRKISTIYRFNHGEVQLSFLWDGSSHEEFYKNRWTSFFKIEIKRMVKNEKFRKIVLSILILIKKKDEIADLQYNLSTFIRNKYNIQVFKRKGVVLHR